MGEYECAISDRQFGPVISKIRADNPDVICAAGYVLTAGRCWSANCVPLAPPTQ